MAGCRGISGKRCCQGEKSRDSAGHLRFAIRKRYGGKDGSNLWMAVIRSILPPRTWPAQRSAERTFHRRNLPLVTMLDRYGSDDQKAMIEGSITGKFRITLASPSPSMAPTRPTWKPRAVRATAMASRGGQSTREDVTHRHACGDALRRYSPRTSGDDGDARGITCLLVRRGHGREVESICGPSTCPPITRVSFQPDVFVPDDALFGEIGRRLSLAQCFVLKTHPQAASSLGAAVTARGKRAIRAKRKPFGRALGKTRRSSGRWSSLRRRRKCCGCSFEDRVGDGQAHAGAGRGIGSPTRCRCAFLGKPPVLRSRDRAMQGAWRGWATRATSRSNTSIRHHAAIASRRQRGDPEAESGGFLIRLYGGKGSMRGTALHRC